ncbi:hypothetical protein [Gaoshiqia sp. Z1-71]|uniref:hypothetical protein n=1 Tax=Gaoshiqia hydrogeniformans TaxID=3290090 RepID=UPI003BF88DB6
MMKTMKTSVKQKLFLAAGAFGFLVNVAHGQSEIISAKLPQSDLQRRAEHQYQVETVYRNHDIYGNFGGKLKIWGKYTSGLDGGNVRWDDVYICRSSHYSDVLPASESLAFINGFSYNYEQNILAPEFFANFPLNSVEAKNLVWDMAGMEFFAWGHTDSLKLNVPYHALNANGPVDLAGHGFFDNRDIVLCWKGITQKDGEQLAVVDFRTLNNPLEVQVDFGERQLQTKGRSHYWGTIWLSVEQNCIDRIELFEDVVLEMGWNDQAEKQLIDVLREMKVTKID